MPEQKALPFVSVNIPAYNEEKFIGACLESLTNQTYPSYEVIVVDDGSTDKTVSIIQQFVAKDPRFKLVHQNHGGEAVARNCAAQHSKGEILCFLDADLAFAPDFIEKLIAPVLDDTAIGTFSREEYVKNYDNPWARSWNLNDGMLTAKRHPDDFPYEDTTFRAMRKSTFDSVGGFSSKGSGDDKTLSSLQPGHAERNLRAGSLVCAWRACRIKPGEFCSAYAAVFRCAQHQAGYSAQ